VISNDIARYLHKKFFDGSLSASAARAMPRTSAHSLRLLDGPAYGRATGPFSGLPGFHFQTRSGLFPPVMTTVVVTRGKKKSYPVILNPANRRKRCAVPVEEKGKRNKKFSEHVSTDVSTKGHGQ
jgi:hypothetical protein